MNLIHVKACKVTKNKINASLKCKAAKSINKPQEENKVRI